MKTYFALIHKDEHSAYGASFPDLPGCFSAADNFSKILPNAAKALELWFEDADLVEPRSIEVVRQELARSAFIALAADSEIKGAL
jgi:predicted RNase H-like HicB family nuclease